jgi:RNA polymerase sigma-32 factor
MSNLADIETARLDLVEAEAPGQENPLSEHEDGAMAAFQVGAALGRLDPRERTVIELRVMSHPPMTLQAVGERLGCTPALARQLERRAKMKLRQTLGVAKCWSN